MLKDLDTKKYTKIYIVTGYTDLRKGARGLVDIIQYKFGLDFYDESSIFLFCGRNAKTIKGVLYEGDGVVVVTKTIVRGSYRWPRTAEEARAITANEFRMIMQGFSIETSIPGGRLVG